MKNQRAKENASTLMVVMGMLAVITVLVGVTLSSTSHNGILTQHEQNFTRALNAADGALEYTYASWKNVITSNGLRSPTNSQLTVSAPAAALHSGFQSSGITFSNFSLVNANQWGETVDASGTTITNPIGATLASIPGFPGWKGVASFYRAQVTASLPSRGAAITVGLRRTFQVTAVPLFQAAIFFEDDINLQPGAKMIIKGLVHTNGNLYAATSTAGNLQFLSNVSYVGNYYETYNPYMDATTLPPQPPLWSDGLTSSTSTTFSSQLHQTTRMEPFGTAPSQLFNTTDTNPNNDSMREIIEPPSTSFTDPPQIAAMRMYNQATVRVAIDRTKSGNARIAITNGSNAALSSSADSAIRAALNVSNTTIYDWRQASNVYLTNVNMGALNTALVAMGTSFNGVLYIQDVTPTGLNAVRLQNGAVLTRDLTIASNNAVFIQGDYNTGGVSGSTHDPLLVPSNNGGNPNGTDSSIAPGYTERSTAVMADAVMILSNNWNDSNSTAALSSRAATPTTVNTAIVAGLVPSNTNNSNLYDGGPHNFPRFLENWSGQDFTYLGSMIQPFHSLQFNAPYGVSSNVYSPPGRKWGFDSLFTTQPPPGTLQSLQYSRGRWERL
jgi:Tfp pilus assembly protein PilX